MRQQIKPFRTPLIVLVLAALHSAGQLQHSSCGAGTDPVGVLLKTEI